MDEIPSTMTASVLRAVGDVALEERPVPTLEPDEVLVQVASVGVCGSDVHYYQHGRIGKYVVEAPLILGHEVSGRIVAVGSDVDPARVGQRVAIEPQRPCRTCEFCRAGDYNLCPRMEFYATPPIDGAFAEYAKIQDDFAFEVPDSISDDAAALMEPLSVGIAAAQKGGVKTGDTVFVAGGGPIGLIDATGATPAITGGIRATRSGGTIVLVGSADEFPLSVPEVAMRELNVTGTFRYTNTWPIARDLLVRGLVELDSLVTHRYGIEQVEEALTATGDALKRIVHPGLKRVEVPDVRSTHE